jgi:hypothetical protein
MDDCVECVKYADTIIEADKENEWYDRFISFSRSADSGKTG